MPANKKYLLKTRLGRGSKVLASTLGSLFAVLFFHTAMFFFFDPKQVLTTTLYSVFISWVLLMLITYWIKKPWVSWLILTIIFTVSLIGIYIGK